MISHISALVLTIQTIELLEIKYKMIICLFVSAGCVLPEIYSLRNKSSAHFIFASISTKQKYLEKKYFSFSLKQLGQTIHHQPLRQMYDIVCEPLVLWTLVYYFP